MPSAEVLVRYARLGEVALLMATLTITTISCHGLSRGQAAKEIADSMALDWPDPTIGFAVNPVRLKDGVRGGLWTVTKESVNGDIWGIELTEKGRTVFDGVDVVDFGPGRGGARLALVPKGKLTQRIRVTGITGNERERHVDFALVIDGFERSIAAYAEYCEYWPRSGSSSSHPGQASFTRYDDGWRLDEVPPLGGVSCDWLSPKTTLLLDNQVKWGASDDSPSTRRPPQKPAARPPAVPAVTTPSPTTIPPGIAEPLNLTLPDGVRSLLDQEFPGWKPPTLTSAAAKVPDQGENGWIASGDFNNDRRQDWAVLITLGPGDSDEFGEHVLVGVLDNGGGFEHRVMERGPWSPATEARIYMPPPPSRCVMYEVIPDEMTSSFCFEGLSFVKRGEH